MASLRRPRAALRAATQVAARLTRTRREHELVVASGLFDREWIDLQVDETPADDDEAVRVLLASPPRVSPHPLFEIDWIDPDHRFQDAGLNQLVWYLQDEKARGVSPHPLIDVDRILREVPAATDHPHGPLAAWLAQASDDSLLPTPLLVPETTLGRFRHIALDALRRHLADTASLKVQRLAPTFTAAPAVLPPVALPSDQPLVSIVMPAWNRAHLLRSAVASVQAQTWGSWELIVVDDGSEDDTVAVLEGLAAFDDRVRVLHLDHGGVSRARNVGIAHARGRYIAFLDTDNTWRPDFLRVMLEHLEAHDWRMAHSVLAMQREGEPTYRVLEGTRTDLLVGNHVDLNVLVAETDLVKEVGGFDESLRRAVDYDLVLKLASHTELHLVGYVGTDYSENPDDQHRISVREPLSWLSVVLGRHLVDWQELAATEPAPGRVSVVLPTRGGIAHSLAWIQATAPPDLDVAQDQLDLELVVSCTRTRRAHRVVVEELAALYPHVRVKNTVADVSLTLASVLGASVATGEHLVFVRPPVRMSREDILRLAEPLGRDDVSVTQPVVLDPAGVVLSAGAVFGELTRPEAFLAGHPISDAQAAGTVDLPAPFSPVVATTRRCFVELGGFDPHFEQALSEVDLGIRAPGRTVLAPTAHAHVPSSTLVRSRQYVTAATLLANAFPEPPPGSEIAWAAAGFEVVGRRNVPVPARGARDTVGVNDAVFLHPTAVVRAIGGPARLDVREAPPQLRWTLDLASPVGPKGEAWGDTHFARSLAAALRDLGQRVAIDPRHARHRSSRDLDDVLLVLRGLDLGQPRPGLLNIEWIISHPDLVTREEAAGFDLVYAAGRPWAQERSAAWDLPIRPLLQCTDPALFNPGATRRPDGPAYLFVGNSRKVFRTSVRAALAAEVDLTIYGANWQGFVPRSRIAGTYVPNDALGSLYASAGVVLNDHWDDMRLGGFLSNRLFDATACGARVVSDEVDGIEEIFGPQVQTFTDEQDAARLLRTCEDAFPGPAELDRLAADVVAHHSFRARAETLLDDAVAGLRRRRDAHR